MTTGRIVPILGYVVLSVLFAANLSRVKSLHMDEHPPVWVYDAIPPALSDVVFKNQDGYTSLKDISDHFFAVMKNQQHDSQMIDRAIGSVLQLDRTTISRKTILLGNDDKGIVDFVKVSFRLFGYHSARIVYLYFVVLGLSICGFLWFTRDALISQVIVGAFLVGHYLILPMVAYHPQLQSVVAPRFLPVLSLIACLHCLFFVRRPRMTYASVVVLLAQVSLLTVVIHMRVVTAWQANLILGFSFVLLISKLTWNRLSDRRSKNSKLAFIRRSVWALPAIAVLLGVLGLNIYRQIAFDQRYWQGEQILTRVVWHNFLSGFAFNPTLANTYHLKIDDLSEIRAVGAFLSKNGRTDEWIAMGGSTAGYAGIKWTNYDRAAKDFFFSILREHPGDSLATVLYYKPQSLRRNLAWLYGFRRSVPDLEVFVSPELGDAMAIHNNWMAQMLDEHHLRFVLWDRVALFMLLVFSLLWAIRPEIQVFGDWIPLGLLLAGSLIPSVVGYPGMHTIAEPALMIAVVVYVTAAAALSQLFCRLRAIKRFS